MARIYSNENVAKSVVDRLRELGHDVLTSHEAGKANLGVSDEQVLAFAHSDDRVLITNNRQDFRRLDGDGRPHVGVVEFTVDIEFSALASRIDGALRDPHARGRFYMSVTKSGYSRRTHRNFPLQG